MAQETRKGKRAPAALRVRFRAATVDDFIEQQAANISSGGMFIKSKSPLSRGTLMVFDFQLQDGAPLIKGVGRVVWARKPEAAGSDPPGMGIKFIRVEPESLPTFKKIMAGKKQPDEPKDVVVRLGDAPSDGPVPGAPSESGEKADGDGKEASASAGERDSSSNVDLRATPRVDLLPSELLKDAVPDGKRSADDAKSDVDKGADDGEKEAGDSADTDGTPTPTPEELAATEKKAAEEVSKTEAKSDETPAPSEEGKPAASAKPAKKPKPAKKEEESPVVAAPAVSIGDSKSDAPAKTEPKKSDSPLSDLFDSSPPEEPVAAAAKPLADPEPVSKPKKDVSAPATVEEPEKKSSMGIIVAVVLVLLLGAGAFYVYTTMMSDGGGSTQPQGGAGQGTAEPGGGAASPEQGGAAPDASAAVQPVPISDASAAEGDGSAAALTPDAGDSVTPEDAAAAQADAGAGEASEEQSRSLVITSEPSDTRVAINQRPVGRTPVTVTLDDAPLDEDIEILLSRINHANWSASIDADDPRWSSGGGRIVLNATLEEREERRRQDDDSSEPRRPTKRPERPSGGDPQPTPTPSPTPQPTPTPPPVEPPPAGGAPDDNPY